MMIETRQLNYFCVLANHLHFTRAADALHVSQSYLSREIKRLEEELGVPLFTRTSRQVALTEAGRGFLRQAHSVLAGLDDAVTTARAIHHGEHGAIRVAFVGAVTYSWLPTVVRACREQYPDVSITIRSEMGSGAQVQALLTDEIDVGLLRLPVDSPDLVTKLVNEEPLIVALPATHDLSDREEVPLELLAKEPFITYSSSLDTNTRKAVIAACLDCNFHPHIRQAVSETHTLVSLVGAGMGVALVPESTRHLKVDGVVYRRLAGPQKTLSLALAWRRSDQDLNLLRNFTNVVAQVAETM